MLPVTPFMHCGACVCGSLRSSERRTAAVTRSVTKTLRKERC